MKLKGKNSEKLNKTKKEKMEVTLKRMEETREKDSQHLRDVMKSKLDWAIKEKEKGIRAIENLKVQINRLEGIIIGLKDILDEK